jgi:hypothetical protein
MRTTVAITAAVIFSACFVAVRAAQEVYVDEDMTWDGSGTPRFTPVYGPDLVSPDDYRDGHWYMRWEVRAKPSTKTVTTQLCMWQNGWTNETCSGCTSFGTPDTYWIDLGTPSKRWKKAAALNWSAPFTAVGVMLKQNSCGDKLLASGACGAYCYPGSDLADHVPIETHTDVIMVTQGSTIEVPAEWVGCPWGEPAVVSIRDMHRRSAWRSTLGARLAGGILRVTGAGQEGVCGRIDIISARGRTVRSFQARGEREFVANVGSFTQAGVSRGVYILKITGDQGLTSGQGILVAR